MTTKKAMAKAAEVLDFYAQEALLIHTLCNRADVPTEFNGEPLSIAQRVALLEDAFQGLLTKYLKVAPIVLH